MYHRVWERGLNPRVSEANFADHMDVIRARVPVVSLTELVRSRGRGRSRVAITFDDGYADNATLAAPILDARGLTATFFVVSGDEGNELWQDRLGHMFLDAAPGTPPVEVEVASRHFTYELGTSAEREQELRSLKLELRTAPDEIDRVLQDVSMQTGSPTVQCADHRRLDETQLRDLAARHEVGAHSRTHRLLTRLTDAALRDELEGSRGDLTARTGRETISLAYPYGGPKAYDDRVVAAARRAGFEHACINVRGDVRRRTDPFRIPRYAVHDWSADEFRQHLSSWLDGDPPTENRQPSPEPAR